MFLTCVLYEVRILFHVPTNIPPVKMAATCIKRNKIFQIRSGCCKTGGGDIYMYIFDQPRGFVVRAPDY